MINTILLYEDNQQYIPADKTDIMSSVNLIDIQLDNILQLKGITDNMHDFSNVLYLNSDFDLKAKHITTPFNLYDLTSDNDIDLQIELNLLVQKYNKVLYFVKKDNTFTDIVNTIPKIVSLYKDKIDIVYAPIIMNYNIHYKSNLQSLVIYTGCNKNCFACPISDTSVSVDFDEFTLNTYIDIKIVTGINIGIPVTHFILNIAANDSIFTYTEQLITAAIKYNIKYIITISPDLPIKDMSNLISLLSYIDILYLETYIYDNSYVFTENDIHAMINTLLGVLPPDLIFICKIAITEDISRITEFIGKYISVFNCFVPTFISINTTFNFKSLININASLFTKLNLKLNI